MVGSTTATKKCPPQNLRYRAMSDSSYPLENVNAANAAGVMWYLHNEVGLAEAKFFNCYILHVFQGQLHTKIDLCMSDSQNILWIFAHQVIIFTPRKFGITRIVRFKVQYKAPEPLFQKGHGHAT